MLSSVNDAPGIADLTVPEVEVVLIPHLTLVGGQTVRYPGGDSWVATLASSNDISIPRLLYATAIKRTVDVVASGLLLAILSPILVLVLVAIRLDSSGPAIFRQNRVGRGGEVFRLYKFRTMTYSPTEEIKWIVDKNGEKRHKVRDDPRITRIGKFLRRTSIDELPQLVNILKGDMSLIGPRPELVEIVHQQYDEWQHERHIVRPGLTGWWQVSGRSDRPMHENTDLDLYYVRALSFKLDILIAIKTIRVVAKGLGAF